METAVRKATRLDYNPPKHKHLSTLVSLTYHNPAIIGEMLDLLERRHRENSWIMSFKVLAIIHVLMRQGNGDRTISYVEGHPACLDTTRLREKSSGVIHIQNIYLYTAYLQQKVDAYRELKIDYVKATMANKVGRLRRLSIKDGLLKETSVLQKQLGSLLKCRFVLDDVDNTISLFAFRLVVEDLLILFQAINEGVVNILEHYFAMSKTDARASLDIYRRFAKQTETVTQFLDRAKRFQHEMQISIPATKHAPLSLAAALEEYLNDLSDQPSPKNNNNIVTNEATPPQRKEPEQPKELIDFFASLENDQLITSSASPTTTPQPSLHNPFRNTMMANPAQLNINNNTNNNIMNDLSLLNQPTLTTTPTTTTNMMFGTGLQQQQPIPATSMNTFSLPNTLSVAPAPTSSLSSSNANPFRSNTMPQLSTIPNMSSSSSTTTTTFNTNQLTLYQPNQQQQPDILSSPLSNPFSQQQQQQQQFQPTQIIGMNNGSNPFSFNTPLQQSQPQQPQQQQWGSSVF
ncbi:ANTH domain-containing protein [Cunninghamella echinulata]|nr:ANTH domain-containing protein [Cunninghamella echinulata]